MEKPIWHVRQTVTDTGARGYFKRWTLMVVDSGSVTRVRRSVS